MRRNLLSAVNSQRLRAVAVLAMSVALAACRQYMHDAPRYEALEASPFFGNGASARTLVANTVPRGYLREDDLLYTGKVAGQFTNTFPMAVTADVMARGRERYNVFCSPCHDRAGTGRGMIVQRGYTQPSSYHIDRLRNAPAGYFYDVITRGFGVMPSYAAQVPPGDRWAIVAYIRALQLSQSARLGALSPAERARVEQAWRRPETPVTQGQPR